MFTVPPGDKPVEGSGDENPLELKSIQKVDLQRLLRAMFPDLAFKPATMGIEEWISVLKLSTMWTFGELRQKAIKWLRRLITNPVEKVMLARKYKVESFLVEGYEELIKRKDGPSLEEAKVLGYEAAIQLYEKRERYRGWESMSQSRRHLANANLIADIEKTFKEELDGIKHDGRAIEEASKPDIHGIENNKLDKPSGSTALTSDSDSDLELNYPALPSRKRART